MSLKSVITPISLILFLESFNASVYRPMYYPTVGTLIEPDGIVVSYDNVKYISLIYKFGNPKIKANRVCTQTATIINKTMIEIQSQYDYLKTMIPDNSKDFMDEFCISHLGLCQEIISNSTVKPKEKRSAELIATMSGLIGLGNSAYTWYTGNRLEEHLNIVRGKMLEVIKEENRITDKLNEVVALDNDIIKKSSISFNKLKQLVEIEACTLEDRIMNNMISVLLLEINRDFSSLINMINGIPDPNILSSNVVEKIINANPDLSNSLYQHDKGLLLTVSKSNLIYTSNNKETLVFLLEIPLIKRHMYSPLFKVYNGGWENQGVYHKLSLPINFYLYSSQDDQTFHAVSSIHESCYYRSHLYICDNSKHFLRKEMVCMNALLKNESYDLCDILVTKKTQGVQIIKTKSGVFSTGSPTVTKINSIGESYHMITDQKLSSNWTQFYPYSSFSKLIIDSIIIVSNRDPIPVIYLNHTYNLQVDFNLNDAHTYLSSNPWTSIKDIESLVKSDTLYTMSKIYSGPSNYSFYFIILILLLIVILIVALWMMWKSFKRTKGKLHRNQIVLSSMLSHKK